LKLNRPSLNAEIRDSWRIAAAIWHLLGERALNDQARADSQRKTSSQWSSAAKSEQASQFATSRRGNAHDGSACDDSIDFRNLAVDDPSPSLQ
jgi:hypothetical protein